MMKNSSGFTLVELLIILLVIGLLVGFSYPPIMRFSDSIKLDAQAKSIAADLHLCWSRALSEDITYDAVFAKETGSYTIKKPNIADGSVIEIKTARLPSRLFFERSITIRFSSSGFVLPGYSGTISIRAKSGGVKKVIVSSYGRVRVE